MLLKNHLIEVFKKASSENNLLLKENVVFKWVHRFGIDSLNELLIHSSVQKENHYEENKEQISLIDDENEEENKEQISLIDDENEEENQEQIRLESLKIFNNNQVFNINQDSNNINQYTENQKLPLPNIKNLRKWINKDKKAS